MVEIFMKWCENGETEAVKALLALLTQEAREKLIFLEGEDKNHNKTTAFDLVVQNRNYETLAELISPDYTYSFDTLQKLLSEQKEEILNVCNKGGHND